MGTTTRTMENQRRGMPSDAGTHGFSIPAFAGLPKCLLVQKSLQRTAMNCMGRQQLGWHHSSTNAAGVASHAAGPKSVAGSKVGLLTTPRLVPSSLIPETTATKK